MISQYPLIDVSSRCIVNVEWLDMQKYDFSICSANGADREETGFMALVDDNAARGFGLQIIADMLEDGVKSYAGWTMDIASDQRPVCTLSFVGSMAASPCD